MSLRGHQPQRPEGGLVQARQSWLSPSCEEEGGGGRSRVSRSPSSRGEGEARPLQSPALLVCVGCLELILSAVFHTCELEKTKRAKGTFLWFQNRMVICFSPQFYRKLTPTGTDDLFTFTRELNKGRNTLILGRACSYCPSGHHPFMTPPFRHSKETIPAALGASHDLLPTYPFPQKEPKWAISKLTSWTAHLGGFAHTVPTLLLTSPTPPGFVHKVSSSRRLPASPDQT